ncbi:MAG TPA: Qat anti-phage system QueC-like protein QatC [Oculatellaceae cyanobacterium]
MKILCAPAEFDFLSLPSDLNVVLYGSPTETAGGSVGAALKDAVIRNGFQPSVRAWDFLSIALSVITADLAEHRSCSPDGWTREFDLTVAVNEPDIWNYSAAQLESLLAYLTTDRWGLHFVKAEHFPSSDRAPTFPDEDSVVLLSGGLDSYIGAVDLVHGGHKPLAVSQTVRGDAEKQILFASGIGNGLRHFQVNHNSDVPDPENSPSQRARSIAFISYGILVATALEKYSRGNSVNLFVCENGLIAVNPPLTGGRLGSLSTRTTHPVVFALLNKLLDSIGLRVSIVNPYAFKTKGEMLQECANQGLLEQNAFNTTSCGRFNHFGYRHCGRCVPCLVRRASFAAWNKEDKTEYVYTDLSKDDDEHARFDDVRSALIGIAECEELGVNRWLGATLSSNLISDKGALRQTVNRGLREIKTFLTTMGVQ